MKFKEYPQEEKNLLEMVWKNPNIKQAELARKLNTSSRNIRNRVHQIRLKGVVNLAGKELYLVADNSGYDLVEKSTARFEMWKKRFSAQINDMLDVRDKW